jgi:hypothetical protein
MVIGHGELATSVIVGEGMLPGRNRREYHGGGVHVCTHMEQSTEFAACVLEELQVDT